MFQLLLTIGLVFVAVIGFCVTYFVGDAKNAVDAKALANGVEAAKVTFAQITARFDAAQVASWVRARQMIFLLVHPRARPLLRRVPHEGVGSLAL